VAILAAERNPIHLSASRNLDIHFSKIHRRYFIFARRARSRFHVFGAIEHFRKQSYQMSRKKASHAGKRFGKWSS
jgi:hypothetical protein